jgi:hypothetical protein
VAGDERLPFEELVKIVLARFPISVGYAESIVRKALDSGDVREEPRLAADDHAFDYILRPSAVRHPGRYSVDDFLYWLALNLPQTEPVTTQPKPVVKLRKQNKRDRAKEALEALWPDGVPDATTLLDGPLCTEVIKWLQADSNKRKIPLPKISDRTILRAARDLGRK